MTAKDKTEDQLLSSIRKNKPVGGAAPQPQTAKRPAPRTATRTRAKPKPSAEAPADSNYQSGRRVWPD